MTSEDKLLCYCAQVELTAHDTKELRKLLEDELNWQALYISALRNGLLPLLYNTLKAYPASMPHNVLTQIKEKSFTNCARNLLQTSSLVSIITLFKENTIEAVPFKGPLLSILLYGDIGQRSFGDLDILISPFDIPAAHALLLSLNYYPELELSPQRLLRYATHEDNLSFRHANNKVVVELHWDLAGAYLSRPLRIQEIDKIPGQFKVTGCPMDGLSNECLLVYLCVHGAKHKWERLEWISSVTTLIRMEQDLDWEVTLNFAKTIQCRRMLLLGLLLAQNLFNSAIPIAISRLIQDDKRLEALETNIMEELFPDKSTGSSSPFKKRFSFFHIRVRDSLGDSIRYQARLFFRPTNVDWQTTTLPASLSFLYFIIRPFRLLVDTVRKVDH